MRLVGWVREREGGRWDVRGGRNAGEAVVWVGMSADSERMRHFVRSILNRRERSEYWKRPSDFEDFISIRMSSNEVKLDKEHSKITEREMFYGGRPSRAGMKS